VTLLALAGLVVVVLTIAWKIRRAVRSIERDWWSER